MTCVNADQFLNTPGSPKVFKNYNVTQNGSFSAAILILILRKMFSKCYLRYEKTKVTSSRILGSGLGAARIGRTPSSLVMTIYSTTFLSRIKKRSPPKFDHNLKPLTKSYFKNEMARISLSENGRRVEKTIKL